MERDLHIFFRQKVKIQPKLRSIEGIFFNEDRLASTNYKPSYQRNYVWDADKASYFIESIFIGTDVPPLILFVNDGNIEIIDGRQRYETIKNFVEGKLKLKKSGLPKLGGLKDFVGKTFTDLDEYYQELFKQTRLRVIEFSFTGESHEPEEEELLKKEIFQRYNSGITPLKVTDVEKAEYIEDDLIQCFTEELENTNNFNLFNEVFYFDKPSTETFLREIRELMVMNMMPIKFYARQTKSVIKHYFDHISDKATSEGYVKDIVKDFFDKIDVINDVKQTFLKKGYPYNRLYSECLFWAFSIISDEGLAYTPNEEERNEMADYLDMHSECFMILRSSFAAERYERYSLTAQYFAAKYKTVNFDVKLDIDEDFKYRHELITNDKQSHLLEFKNLHINKQDATTYDVSDICLMVNQSKYLIRPSYQRKEVISQKKASRIIESLLLEINLPPIFIYRRKDNVCEVIDGQQRLLSILAFLGKPYKNERGEEEYSQNNNFKLNLKDSILTSYHNCRFSDLPVQEQRKLTSAGVWLAEIDSRMNEEFDPIDLFVRLNNKPYPIKADTFEMWNSYINRSIIEIVKKVNRNNKTWLYLRKTSNARMENENLWTVLAYFEHQFKRTPRCEWIEDGLYPDKTMDIFVSGGKVSGRLKSKVEITRFLQEDISEACESVNRLEFVFILKLYSLLKNKTPESTDSNVSKTLDDLMCVDNGKRTIQGFYILWLLCHDLQNAFIEENSDDVFTEIKDVFRLMKETHKAEDFKEKIKVFKQKYCKDNYDEDFGRLQIGQVADVQAKDFEEVDFYLSRKTPWGMARFSKCAKPEEDGLAYGISVKRYPFTPKYIEAILCSNLFCTIQLQIKGSNELTVSQINNFILPFPSAEQIRVFESLIALIDKTKPNSSEYLFFCDVMDLAIFELYEPDKCHAHGISVLETLANENYDDILPEDLCKKWSDASSAIRLYTYRSKDLVSD